MVGIAGAFRALVLFGLAVVAAAPASAAERREALVIGNGAYRESEALASATADAREVAAALRRLGFSVGEAYDLSHEQMTAALRRFGRAAKGADIALLFYAGRAGRGAERSWLLPVDASIERDRDLEYDAVALDAVLGETEGVSRLRIAFIDAYSAGMVPEPPVRAAAARRGKTAEPVADQLVVYTDADAAPGRRSAYPGALARDIGSGLELNQLLGRVRDAVREATGGRQQPFVVGSLGAAAFSFGVAPAEPAKEERPPTTEAWAGSWQGYGQCGSEITLDIRGGAVHGSISLASHRSFNARYDVFYFEGSVGEDGRLDAKVASLDQAALVGTMPAVEVVDGPNPCIGAYQLKRHEVEPTAETPLASPGDRQ